MKRALTCALLLASSPLYAHSIPTEVGEIQAEAELAVSTRSRGAVEHDEAWSIAGIMMGGHAWPAERGMTLDEAALGFGYRADERLFAVMKIASHGGGHDDGLALEHAWVGYVCCGDTGPLMLEAGRMSAAFAPSVSEHSSARVFADASLTSDAFFGRHFHDDGIRLWRHQPDGFSFGAEIWHGNAFPATPGNGAADLFANLHRQYGHLTLNVGGWLMLANAEHREDHRYSESHSHGGGGAAAEIVFEGETRLAGLHALLDWKLAHARHLRLEAEWIALDTEGEIADDTRHADLDSRYQGVRIQPELVLGRHRVALRGERLVLDNNLRGAAAPALAADANLITDDSPWRAALGWRWQARPGLALRADLTRDHTLPEASTRVTLGLVWQHQLHHGQDHHHDHH